MSVTDLALERDVLLHRVIAEKASRKYALEFTTASGKSYIGFLSGLDEDMIQIVVPHISNPEIRQDEDGSYEINPWVQGSAGDYVHKDGYYQVDKVYHVWLSIVGVESIIESTVGTRHFAQDAKTKIESKSRAFIETAAKWKEEQNRR